MATIKKYNGSLWENAVVRKFGTATEAVENPLYSDGTAITAYTLKGNEEHTGTPTPSNPVDVNGVGVRTENVYDKYSTVEIPNLGTRYGITCAAGTYSIYNDTENTVYYGEDNWIARQIACEPHSTATVTIGTAQPSRTCGFFMSYNDASLGDVTIVEGSTAPDHYIPYGYKIPILSGQQTTNIYLGSTQTVRQIKKLVLTGDESWQESSGTYLITNPNDYLRSDDITYMCSHFQARKPIQSASNLENLKFSVNPFPQYPRIYFRDDSKATLTDWTQYLSDQYANGTPVTIWYVLATPETATVNEPLMKIGTYADTLSNATAIPTTEGANSITVDTTVQPSEFTATWAGWHDSSVKEWDGSDWQ